MREYARIDRYLDFLESELYPEPCSELHDHITGQVFELFIAPNAGNFKLCLDVGCGQGPALSRFNALGIKAIGITLGSEDNEECHKRGYTVRRMDQSFLDFSDHCFDLVYARHVLEHSPFPLLTLFEFNRVMKENAFAYVEVPWAESIHATNPNHYSILGKKSWLHLFRKARFSVLKDIVVGFKLTNGTPDEYWGWWLQKSSDLP